MSVVGSNIKNVSGSRGEKGSHPYTADLKDLRRSQKCVTDRLKNEK